MAVVLFRIDDRLVHGQVTTGWARILGLLRIILASDRIAASDWEGELYQSVTPREIETVIVSVDDVPQALASNRADDKRTMLLVESTGDARRIIDGGYKPECVNVGGLHYCEGKKEVLPYIFLGPKDAADLAYISGLGIRLEARDVPGGKSLDVRRLLTVFGFDADSGGSKEAE